MTAICLCNGSAKYEFTVRTFNLFRCKVCSLLFVFPRHDASNIYDADYFQGGTHGFGFTDYESDKTASRGYLQQYLRWLKKLPLKNGSNKLLDVGAANGYFVEMAARVGFEASGIEISSQAVEWAKKLGRSVEKSSLEEYANPSKFDILTALDVLEHIENPKEFLGSAHRKLVTNGYLLINVPNSGSLFAKLSGEKWHAIVPPEHWFFFNRKSLKLALESTGFSVIKMRSISKSFNFSYIYLTILNSPQIPNFVKSSMKILAPIANGPIGKLKIYLPLFDNLTVIARAKNLTN